MASHSNFPQITTNTFLQTAAHWNILDKQYLNNADLGIALTGATANSVKFEHKAKIDKQLTRFEFMEVLLRIWFYYIILGSYFLS